MLGKVAMAGRDVEVIGEFDVVVIGGGFLGICAAVGAMRYGVTVALFEADGMLGGQPAEIYTFGLDGFFDDSGRQFVKGVPWEIMERTFAEGQSDPVWTTVDYPRMEREGVESEMGRLGMTKKHTKSQTWVDPAAFRYVLQTMVEEEEISTFLECPVVDVILEGNTITGVVMQGHYGPFALRTRMVVDTTPHAIVAALAGKPFPHPQVYTGTHPRVSGVDIDRLLDYIRDNPDEVDAQGPISGSPDSLRELVSKDMALIMRGFGRARDLAISRDPAYGITGHGEPPFLTFFYDGDGCGTYWIRPSEHRYTRLDDPIHLSNTLCALRRAQWLTHRLFRDFVPGFERAHLLYPNEEDRDKGYGWGIGDI